MSKNDQKSQLLSLYNTTLLTFTKINDFSSSKLANDSYQRLTIEKKTTVENYINASRSSTNKHIQKK